MNVTYDTAKKLAHLVEYLPSYWTDFRNLFHHMKVLYVQMMDQYLIFFQFFKGCCHGNQIMLWKCNQRRLIALAFVALVLENELQYYGLTVRINSGDDGATSSKNLVNLSLLTPEMTGLICERQVQHGQKNWRISLNISEYIGRIFNIFTIWKCFTCRWWIRTLFSNLSRDVAMATK